MRCLGGSGVKTFNFILLGVAVLYTLLLTVFGGEAVDHLKNIAMYLFPIANTVVLNGSRSERDD